MDRLSKKIFKFLLSHYEDPSKRRFLLDDTVPAICDALSVDDGTVLAALCYLESIEYIAYIKGRNGSAYGFVFTHKALHHREFTIRAFCQYLIQKWIDILALVVAVIALIVSIIALSRQLPMQ